jgi:hypothetical protein
VWGSEGVFIYMVGYLERGFEIGEPQHSEFINFAETLLKEGIF